MREVERSTEELIEEVQILKTELNMDIHPKRTAYLSRRIGHEVYELASRHTENEL